MSDKYLIINADDFGMCRAANLATFDLLKCGGITSATIMTPCGWAPEAAQFAKENPEFAIGVHLTNTSEWSKYRWAPVSRGSVASLVDEDGYMWKGSGDFEGNADIDETEEEIRAQIEKIKKLGLDPSHLDNHMGTLYGIETGRFELLNLTIDIAAEYGLPFRCPTKFTDEQYNNQMLEIKVPKETILGLFTTMRKYAEDAGVPMIDYLMPGDWNGPQKENYENYKEYIYEFYKTFEPGITETYIHPSLECDELKGTTHGWEKRVWEHRLFAEPQTRRHIESLGIKLINYRDLAEMRRK
ncbi:MAG: polysaccharide deacetylase family protein [Oscillospiraceae bacterium]|nr:polysaccharide deacetylase family protein [Oscillospiraceae bacterium]